MGSTYKRGNIHWIKYYRNGKSHRESSGSKKEADAKRLLKKREGEIAGGAGSLVAPFDGNHGWYWLNIQENSINISLEVYGYYESLAEIYRGTQ